MNEISPVDDAKEQPAVYPARLTVVPLPFHRSRSAAPRDGRHDWGAVVAVPPGGSPG